MDLRQLRYFVAIAEAGNLSRASEALRIAQPALSQTLRKLEDELGVELFTRHARGVELNEIGEVLLEHARSILRDVDETSNLIRSQVTDPAGEVRLGLPTTAARTLTGPLIQELSQRYPKIRLHIVEGMSGHLNAWINERTLDIALLYNPTFRQNDRLLPFMIENLCLVCRSDAKEAELGEIPFHMITDLQLVLPGRPHVVRNLIEMIASTHKLPMQPPLNLDSLPGLIEMVRRGSYTVLPVSGVTHEIESGEMVAIPIVEPILEWELYILAPSEGARSRAAIAVIALVQEVVTDLVTKRRWSGRLL